MTNRSARIAPVALIASAVVACDAVTHPEIEGPNFSIHGAGGNHGKIVFASRRDGDPEIYAMKSDGSELTRLTNNPAFDTEPRWSRDGQWIVFGSDRNSTPPNQDIWIMDENGGNLRQVTSSPTTTDFFPQPSPDGKRIAFTRGQEPPPFPGAIPSIFVVNVDGTGETNLTNNPAVCVPPFPAPGCFFEAWPRWSPDGQQILFNRAGTPGDFDIYVMNADGTGRTNLTPGTEGINDFFADWSPDGKYIAFTSSRGGPPDLYTMKADGSDVRKVTPAPGLSFAPVWSPDGKKLAFHGGRGAGNFDIFTIDVDGTNETQLTFDAAEDVWAGWSSGSMVEAIARVAADVAALGAPVADKLGIPLERAIKQVRLDNPARAVERLRNFKGRVRLQVRKGTVTAEQGQGFLDAVQPIIRDLNRMQRR